MRTEELEIPGVVLARPAVHEDERGWFMEVLREEVFGASFVQSNHARSREHVLRGLHYHREQADAWYVAAGEARVGLADLRGGPEALRVMTLELSAGDPAVLYLPPGVAHGYYAVTEVDLIYWVTRSFDGTDEYGVPWDDPQLAVPWKVSDPILSARDRSVGALEWTEVEGVLGR
jgi:dTDP-4-dehydrorhamnose 3,5-epimerase